MATLIAETSTSWVWAVVGFIVWILIISWTATLASRKGRSGFLWGLLAFFFSFIALIVVMLMPSKLRNT